MQFNDKIRELRKKQGFSQESLAEKLNVSRQSVSKWESGASTPEIHKILLLCDLFEVSTDELLRNSNNGFTKVPPENSIEEASPFILRFLRKYKIEVLIFMAFLMLISFYFNFNYRSTIKAQHQSSTSALSRTHDHFMSDVHFFREKSQKFLQNRSSVDPQDLIVYSEGLMALSQIHSTFALSLINIGDAEHVGNMTSLVWGISHSTKWFTQAIYEIHSLDDEKLERVHEFLPLLDEVLLATDEYQSAIDSDESSSLIENQHLNAREKVLELMLLSYLHGVDPDILRF